MCGIAGFLRRGAPSADRKDLQRMGEVIRHRGPDAGGEYLDDEIGLVHRRLSIIDLSPEGNQPMVSSSGRHVIVFNGEIYNFRTLRQELEKEGIGFKTRTDTEVLLSLFERRGPDCLKDLNGMFAFAIWDREDHSLFLARDRIGKKPLYYYHGGGDRFAFASEIKSILEIPGIPSEIKPTAVADYLKYLYVPAPKTIFRNIYKVEPGHWLQIRPGEEPKTACYWDVDFAREFQGSLDDAAEELLHLLKESTACRMVADVPLGAFLSGGIDSSAVVALMAESSPDPVKTCSIGFADKRHDETPFAREVAQLFGADHAEFFVRENLPDTVSMLARYFDEPFADSSSVPTYHVSRLARQKVTVALAGDGGDESFGGYEKYSVDRRENQVRQLVPHSMLRLLNGVAQGQQGTIMRKMRSLTAGALSEPGHAFYRTNSFISDADLETVLANDFREKIDGYDPGEHTLRHWNRMQGADHVASMLYTDLKTYLPGDILVKVDRMSMANSLEVRAPLLDHRIIEFAASLPSQWKIKGSTKKFILKKSFGKVLPNGILHRRKHGFTVPLGSWFRGDLKRLSEELLLSGGPLGDIFSQRQIRIWWDQHQSGVCDHGTVLWTLLSFALWHREYMEGASSTFMQKAGNG